MSLPRDSPSHYTHTHIPFPKHNQRHKHLRLMMAWLSQRIFPTLLCSLTAFGNMIGALACTTTFTVNPSQVAGEVSTTYRATSTQTFRVDCRGCSLAIQTQAVGFGPPPHYTSTSTAAETTTTTYICG